MTLVKCKECGKEISKNAMKCPHCGAQLPTLTQSQRVVWAVVMFIIIFIPVMILLSKLRIWTVWTS